MLGGRDDPEQPGTGQTYYLGVIADDLEAVSESDETNNAGSAENSTVIS